MSETNADGDLDYSKLKVAELKQELKKRGLSVDGKKSELLERLQNSIGDAALLDDTHDDLLDDDDLSDEEVLNDSAIIDAPSEPVAPKPIKRPGEEEKRHPKKIILNRKVVEAPDPPLENDDVTPADTTPTPAVSKSESPQLIKLTGLSQKERLEKRAARFGAALSSSVAPEAPKDPRNIRFNAAPASSPVVAGVNIDVLKKRAERFGTVAPILEKVQIEEKKKLRSDRFGQVQAEGNLKVPITAANRIGDKKAQRAARFEITS